MRIFQIFALLFAFVSVKAQQYVHVDISKNADELVKDVFIGAQNASCISVSNILLKGWQNYGSYPISYGYFEKGTLPFDIDKGIILSTGAAEGAPGPNNFVLSDGNASWPGDADLEREFGPDYLNATSMEFDFIPSNTTEISFDYAFLSEEYNAGNCRYSDAFAFLIKKASDPDTAYRNIALVPGTNSPVSSLSIKGGSSCPQNAGYFGGFNYLPDLSPSLSATNYNGQTKVLTAKSAVVPGEKYHIKLVIADHINGLYDSAVFLKAGSFVGKKDLGADLLFTTGNPLCEGSGSKIIDATTAGATAYQWYKDGVMLPGERQAKLTIPSVPASAGVYEVEIDLGGCHLKGTLKIEIQEKPIIAAAPITFCDEKMNASIPIQFDQIEQQIISNYNNTYRTTFYLNPIDAQNGTGTPLPNGWLLTQNTTVYARISNIFGCNVAWATVPLKIGTKISLLKNTFTKDICDDNRVGEISFNLSDYNSEFITDPAVQITYFNTVSDAQNNTNPISPAQTSTALSKTFGIRFTHNGVLCPNVASITIIKKTPNKSSILQDDVICANATTTLDAGSGFDYYQWSTGAQGATNSSITNVGIGDYWVDLSSNGCTYRQHVKITAAALPIITSVEVNGNTVTVSASGGIAPYKYSLNGIDFQVSNVFNNVPRGKHSVYVQDTKACDTVTQEFVIINLINVITPNGDGLNDHLDYSDLKLKNNVKMEIFDRYGNPVFTGTNGQFIWDGKSNGRTVPTGTYWYILNWTEPGSQTNVHYQGWILVKNRN